MRPEAEVLEHETELCGEAVELAGIGGIEHVVALARELELIAVEHDAALVRALPQIDAAQQRALARAAGADDRDGVAGVRCEVGVLEDVEPGVTLVDVLEL